MCPFQTSPTKCIVDTKVPMHKEAATTSVSAVVSDGTSAGECVIVPKKVEFNLKLEDRIKTEVISVWCFLFRFGLVFTKNTQKNK